jgi:hypothetical protein
LLTITAYLEPSRQAVIRYTLEFKRTIGAPDGFKRSIITANNVFPGPAIRATVGDSLEVRTI